jgi:hypothetical protein
LFVFQAYQAMPSGVKEGEGEHSFKDAMRMKAADLRVGEIHGSLAVRLELGINLIPLGNGPRHGIKVVLHRREAEVRYSDLQEGYDPSVDLLI